ncbi:MAG: hypothetical protein D6824_05840 [Planctomycetota bacterium]|nr:MAG: hypothetical protein D6824_05840 [Planctomycetota bacterium]
MTPPAATTLAQPSSRPPAREASAVEQAPGSLLKTARTAPGSASVALWHPGWLTLLASLALAGIGIEAIATTSGLTPGELGPFAARQAALLFVGLASAVATAAVHYRLLLRLTPALSLLTLALLVFLLLPFAPEVLVTPRNGARRWISLGVTDFQPSELAKIVYVLAVARHLRFRKNHRRLAGLLPPALITFAPMGLILLEPDLGTAALFIPALFAMLIAAGAKLKHIVAIVVVATAVSPTLYPLLQPHQKARIQAMVNQLRGDRSQAESINYQGDRAVTLVGAGGATGLGERRSRAVLHFNRLPEDHNDMIFAVIANRFGFVGGAITLGLFGLWIAGALGAAVVCKDPFGRLVAVGLAAIVATQTLVNVGMTVGLLPITGMTLPYVSYGGSSLVTALIMTGLVFNIAMRRPQRLWRESFDFTRES